MFNRYAGTCVDDLEEASNKKSCSYARSKLIDVHHATIPLYDFLIDLMAISGAQYGLRLWRFARLPVVV
jgi:hypothetical protein